jgi:DNA-binding SARP family transcriptional activator
MGQSSDIPASGPPGRFEARLFGPFWVLRDGIEIADPAWGRRTSTRTLLKWFLLNPGQLFSTAELCEVLWSGRSVTKKINDLHVTLHGLRRVLEPDLPGRSPSRFIRTDSGRYRFEPADRWWTDVNEIRQLWASALCSRDSGAYDTAIASLNRILHFYSQGFLPEDLYADAFAGFRDFHEQGHDEALRVLLGLYRDTGRRFEVLTCAQRILDRDGYSEAAVTALVEAHLEQGNLAAAIGELDRFTRIQEDDLGVRPSPHLLRLRDRARRSSGGHCGGR